MEYLLFDKKHHNIFIDKMVKKVQNVNKQSTQKKNATIR